jgi:hypothetical protein
LGLKQHGLKSKSCLRFVTVLQDLRKTGFLPAFAYLGYNCLPLKGLLDWFNAVFAWLENVFDLITLGRYRFLVYVSCG